MRKKNVRIVFLAAGLSLFAIDALADWSPTKRLTWTSGSSFDPVIATDSGTHIHVVWSDYTSGNFEIYYKRSTDAGATWDAIKRLTWTSGSSSNPAIATGSCGITHLFWSDRTPGNTEIYYKRSLDAGTNWSPAKRLTWTSGDSSYSAIGVDSSDALHVVWMDYTPDPSEIYYKQSTDAGVTWSPVKRLTWTAGGAYIPAIAIDADDAIHVVWHDFLPGDPAIYYKKSTDGGTNWSAAKRLTWASGMSYQPAVAAGSDNTIHVVWEADTPGNLEIYYKRSTNGGTTWSAVKRLTWTSSSSYIPAMAIGSDNTIQIVWYDLTPGNYEIYSRQSEDGGATWGAVKRLTWTSGTSMDPIIAVDLSNVFHLVYEDNTPGNEEVYYKKGR